ncbi:MAG TPA: hypothetical protein VMT68_17010 [Caulobacteraceae bacterium]|nr:hypothetical protein [Caulobacteraceae bacterium]
MATYDTWLCEQNIARFRSQLSDTRDEERRRRLLALLADQQLKLDRLASPLDKPQ